MWDNAPETLMQALKATAAICLLFIFQYLLLWLSTVSPSAAVIIFMALLVLLKEENEWPNI